VLLVSISGDTTIVGAKGDDSSSGSAYVFVKPAGGWTNSFQTAKLTALDAAAFDQFGRSVSISGDTAIVGAFGDDDAGSFSGSAYVFVKPARGWTNSFQTAKLTASDAAASDLFGNSVAVSGDTVVVGSPRDDDVPQNSGSAYVFDVDPVQALQNLIDLINSLGLPFDVQTSLTSPLNAALTILNDNNSNNDTQACGTLTAFINEVDVNEQNGQLTPGEANLLRQSAEKIKSLIGCS